MSADLKYGMCYPAGNYKKETFFSPRVKIQLAVFTVLSWSLNVKIVIYAKL